MPSGRSGGGSSHFGGSRSFGGSSHFGRSSFGGSSHFGGSHRSSGSSRVHMPSMRWRPHTTVIFGRPVYFGAGRATTSSLLSVLIVLAVMVAVVLGINWYNYEEDLTFMRENYNHYHGMAVSAELDANYQVLATVTGIEEWKDSGKFRVLYEYGLIDGYSFYVYDEAIALQLKRDGVTLAIDDKKTMISLLTDSIPLDYKDTTLEDDAEYVDCAKTRDSLRLATILVAGLAGAMFVISLIVSLTAKKATPEQIAATEKAKFGQSAKTAETPNGTWRCVYCDTLNDSTETTCDGCGAGRQK